MPNIDENVVKMSFDNKQFEEGVSQSLKTIDDLKKALKFDAMSDSLQGLENISTQMSQSLEGLSESAEKVARTFSPLGKIVNKTLDELTGPIAQKISEVTKWSTGFAGLGAGSEKYEKYTKAVQTITNATKKSVTEVSKYLDVLMKYTDETSYDFSEMVTSIGKFTSVGIDLERAEAAMEGIANWAAKSGAGKQEANRAMYNISQAMGAGAMKLIDWKSIENANMATKEFKETAIATAEELGVLSKASGVTYQNFNETLKSGWLTADVLTTVLAKYADTSTEFGLAAFHAAQEALTFTDAIDALKDAISSGWMKTMELLFGNLDEARVMWTNVANGLIEFVDVLTGWRNELLQGWHDLGGYNVMVEAASNVWQTFMNVVIGVKEAIANVFPPATANNLLAFTNQIKQASDNLLGAFGIDTYTTVEKEVKVAVDYAEKLNKLLKSGDKGQDVKLLQQQLLAAGFASDKSFADGVYGPKTKEAVKKLQKTLGVDVTGVWDKATKQAASLKKVFINDEIEIHEYEYKNVEEVVEKYEETVNYAHQINKMMKRGDKGSYVQSLQKQLIKLGYLNDKKGADGIYGPKTEEAVKKLQKALGVEVTGAWDRATKQAAEMSDSFKEVVEKERTVLKDTQGLTGPMAKLQSIVSGVASIVKMIVSIAKGAFNVVRGVFHIFDPLLSVIGRIASAFAGMFTNLSQQMEEDSVVEGWVGRITNLLKPLANVIEWIANAIHGFIDEYAYFLYDYDLENSFANFFNFILYNLKNNVILGPVINFIETIASKVMWLADTLIGVLTGVFGWITTNLNKLFSGGFAKEGAIQENGLVVTLVKIFYTVQAVVFMIVDFLAEAFGSLFNFDTKMKDPNKSKTAIVLDGFLGVVTTIAQGLLLGVTLIGYGLKQLLSMSSKYVVPIVRGMAPVLSMVSGDIKAGQVKTLAGLLLSFWAAFATTDAGKFVQKGIDRVKEFFNTAKEYLQEKFPGIMSAFAIAWEGLKGFFTWDASKTVFDNLKDKFEMLKTGVISAVNALKQKMAELKNYIAFLFTINEDTGKLNLFSELPKLLNVFKPVVDLFVKLKDKFVSAWQSFIGVTNEDVAIAEEGKALSVFDVVRNFFAKFASIDWGKYVKPAIYALAGYTILSGIKAIRNLTETINDKGVMGILFGGGGDGEDGWADKAMKLAASAAILAGALGLLAIIPADKAAIGLGVLTGFVGMIMGASALIKKFDLKDAEIDKMMQNFGSALVSFGKALILIVVGLNLMMGTVKNLNENNGWGNFVIAVGIIIVLLGVLAGLEIAISKLGGKKGKDETEYKVSNIYEMCKGVVLLVVSLIALIKTIDGADPGLIVGSLGMIMLLLAELAGIELLLSKFGGKLGKDEKANKASGVLEMCVGLMFVVKSFTDLIKTLRKIKPEQNDRVAESFAYIATFLAELGAIVVLLGAFGKNFGTQFGIGIEIGVMMFGLYKVIEGFSKAITAIRGTDPELMKWFAIGLVGSLFVLGAVMTIIGKLGIRAAISGAIGLVAFVYIIIKAIDAIGSISDDILNRLSTTLRLVGDRLVFFSQSAASINWDAINYVVAWIKVTLLPMLEKVAQSYGTVEQAYKTMALIERFGLELRDYAYLLSEVGKNGISGSVCALIVVSLAQEIANAAASVNVPDDLLSGKLSLLGAHLLLYSDMLAEVTEDNKSGAALQMVQDAKDIADAIGTITFDNDVAKRLILVAAALKLYYRLLSDIGKTDENGNPIETNLAPDEISLKPETLKKVFEALAAAVPKDTASQISAYQENGDVDLVQVGLGIVALGEALEAYAENIGKFTDGSVQNANTALEGITGLDKYLKDTKIEDAGSYLSTNKENISSFSAHIITLGTALGRYAMHIGRLSSTKVTTANEVLTKFMEIGDKLTGKNDNFWTKVWTALTDKTGENRTKQMQLFKEDMEQLGIGIKGYYEAIQDVDLDKLTNANDIVDEIIEFSNNLPQIGGIFGYLTGNNETNIGQFSPDIAKLGVHLQEFSNYVLGITSVYDNVDNSVKQMQGTALDYNKLEPAFQVMERIMGWGKQFFDDNYFEEWGSGYKLLKFENVTEAIVRSVKNIAELGTAVVGEQKNVFGDITKEGTPVITALMQIGNQMTEMLAQGVKDSETSSNTLTKALQTTLYFAATKVKNNQDHGSSTADNTAIKALGTELVEQIAIGIEQESSQNRLEEAIKTLMGVVTRVMASFYGSFVQIGGYLNYGLVEGITKYSGVVANAMHALATGKIVGPVLDVTEVASPSRKFEWIAQMCALGLKNGFDKYSYLVKDSTLDLANSSVLEISAAFDSTKFSKTVKKSIGGSLFDTFKALLIDERDAKKEKNIIKQILVMTGYLNEADFHNVDKITDAVVRFKKEVMGYEGDVGTGWGHQDSINLYRIAKDALPDDRDYDKYDYEKEMVTALGGAYDDTAASAKRMSAAQKKLNKTIKEATKKQESFDRIKKPLSYGDKGEQVKYLQQYINSLSGSKNGVYVLKFNLKEDGVFGKETQKAVKEMQHLYKVEQTGALDAKTMKAISAENAKTVKELKEAKANSGKGKTSTKTQSEKKTELTKKKTSIKDEMFGKNYKDYDSNQLGIVRDLLAVAGYVDASKIKHGTAAGKKVMQEAVSKFRKENTNKTGYKNWDASDFEMLYYTALNNFDPNKGRKGYSNLYYGNDIYNEFIREATKTGNKKKKKTSTKKKSKKAEKSIKEQLFGKDSSNYTDYDKRVTKELLYLSGYLDKENIQNEKVIGEALKKFSLENTNTTDYKKWSASDFEMLYYTTMNKINKDTDVSGLKYGSQIMAEFTGNTKDANNEEKALGESTSKTTKQQKKQTKEVKKTTKEVKKLNKEVKKTNDSYDFYKSAKGRYYLGAASLADDSLLRKIKGPLKYGDKGDQVKALQQYLNSLNLKGVDKLKENGVYGKETQKAVQKWQKKLGVDQFGDVDETTLQKGKEKQGWNDYVEASDKQKRERERKRQEAQQRKTNAIMKAQNFLVKQGFLQEGSYQLGEMDAATEAALRIFNQKAGISNSDMGLGSDLFFFDETAYEKWQSKIGDTSNAPKADSTDTEFVKEMEDKYQEAIQKRQDVLALQHLLEYHGFLKEKDYTPGIYGKETQDAEKEFNKIVYGSEKPDEQTRKDIDNYINAAYGSIDDYLDTPDNIRRDIDNKNGMGAFKTHYSGNRNRIKEAQKNRLYRQMFGYDYDTTEGTYRTLYSGGKWIKERASDAVVVQAMQDEMEKRGFLANGQYNKGHVDQTTLDAFATFKQELFGYTNLPDTHGRIEFTSGELNKLENLFNTYGSWDAIWKSLGKASSKGFNYDASWMPKPLEGLDNQGWKKQLEESINTTDSDGMNINIGEMLGFDTESLKQQALTDVGTIIDTYVPALSDGLKEVPNEIEKKVNESISELTSGTGEGGETDSLFGIVNDVMGEDGVVGALKSAEGQLESVAGNRPMWKKILDIFVPSEEALTTSGESIGKNFFGALLGVFTNTTENKPLADAAAQELSSTIDGAYCEAEQINSPSVVWTGFGKNLVEGLVLGITENESLALSAIDSLTSNMIAHAKAMLESVKLSIVGDDGSSITFRPVLDSSNTEGSGSVSNVRGFSGSFDTMNNNLVNIHNVASGIQTDIQILRSTIEANDVRMTNRFSKLNSHLSAIDKDLINMKIYLDTGALVGGIGPQMGRWLGQNRFNKTGGK